VDVQCRKKLHNAPSREYGNLALFNRVLRTQLFFRFWRISGCLQNSPYSSNEISAVAVGRSFEVEVSRTRSFSRARNNLAFRVPIPIPKIAAVSLMDRSSS
jgi:hypothetical protein